MAANTKLMMSQEPSINAMLMIAHSSMCLPLLTHSGLTPESMMSSPPMTIINVAKGTPKIQIMKFTILNAMMKKWFKVHGQARVP